MKFKRVRHCVRWEPLGKAGKKAARKPWAREAKLLGGEDDVFRDDAGTAAYLAAKFEPHAAGARGRGCPHASEMVRFNIERDLERMRMAGGCVGAAALEATLRLVAPLKGAKRSLQMMRKWEELGLPLSPGCYEALLAHYPVGRTGHLDFYWEAVEKGGCDRKGIGVLRALLQAAEGAGVAHARRIVRDLKDGGHIVDEELARLVLFTARSEEQLTEAMELAGVSSADLVNNPAFIPAIAATAAKKRTAMQALDVWRRVTQRPPDQTWWRYVLLACIREGTRRKWGDGLASLREAFEYAQACDDPPAEREYAAVLKACRAAMAGADPPTAVVKYAEEVFAAAQRAGKGADMRQWISLLQVYHTAGLPRRALLLRRFYRAKARHVVRPTKAFMATYLAASKGVAPDPVAPGVPAKEREPRQKLLWRPIPARPYKRSACVPTHAHNFPPPIDEDRPPPTKGLLPWLPGRRPPRAAAA